MLKIYLENWSEELIGGYQTVRYQPGALFWGGQLSGSVSNHFNPNNCPLILLQISLLFTCTPALNSRQKEKPHDKKEKTRGKNLITSRQNEKPHGKKKKTRGKKKTSRQNEKDSRQNLFDAKRTSFAVRSRLFFLPWVFFFFFLAWARI